MMGKTWQQSTAFSFTPRLTPVYASFTGISNMDPSKNSTICFWVENGVSHCPKHPTSWAANVLVSFHFEKLKKGRHISYFNQIPCLSKTMLVNEVHQKLQEEEVHEQQKLPGVERVAEGARAPQELVGKCGCR